MLPGMEMLACPNLAVSPEVMQHIVHVESSANPYAIGVVGGQLERQPRNLSEALATVQMLDAKGYNFSVGLAQVNRANLDRFGLDSYQKAFNVCGNISAGAQILADCYASAHGDWGRAFSCYYSGDFITGFRDGYVQKIYASINHEASGSKSASASRPSAADAIALRPQLAASKAGGTPTRATGLKPVIGYAPGGANYRVALRSMAIDTAAAATVPAIGSAIRHVAPIPTPTPSDPMAVDSVDANSGHAAPTGSDQANASAAPALAAGQASIASAANVNDVVFVPEVRGPSDPTDGSTPMEPIPTMTQATLSHAGADRADLRQEQRDDAFVF